MIDDVPFPPESVRMLGGFFAPLALNILVVAGLLSLPNNVANWYTLAFITLVTVNSGLLFMVARSKAAGLRPGLAAGYFTLLLLAPCLCSNVFFFANWWGPTARQGEQRAEPAIAALEAYKLEHGEYPMQLLVSPDSGQVPRPSRFSSYRYLTLPSRQNRQAFELGFRVRGDVDTWNCYSSETEEWLLRDSNC